MLHALQRNFFSIWIFVLLGIAIALTLTFTGCSSGSEVKLPVEGRATSVLGEEAPAGTACHDSDGGINKEIRGTVTFGNRTVSDECVGPFLVEYYCDDGRLANQNIRCDCSAGKCI